MSRRGKKRRHVAAVQIKVGTPRCGVRTAQRAVPTKISPVLDLGVEQWLDAFQTAVEKYR